MIGASERISAEFYLWEREGRGHSLWPFPVALEPVARMLAPSLPAIDDGRKTTMLSRLRRRIAEELSLHAPPPPRVVPEPSAELEPPIFERGEIVDLQVTLPPTLRFDRTGYANLFTALSVCAEPLAFELIATGERIIAQFAVSPRDARLLTRQLEALVPDAPLAPVAGFLREQWGELGSAPAALVEFGLGKEFMVPLASNGGDPFGALAAAFSTLCAGEVATYQVIFTPVESPWRDWIVRSVSRGDGSALFVNAPELLSGARQKVSEFLYAAVARIAVRAEDWERTWEIACDLGGALGVYGSANGNELVPLHNDGYPAEAHEADFLARQSRRSGMILNGLELAGLVHLPSSDVRAPRLRIPVARSKPVPPSVTRNDGLRLGTNVHAGVTRVVGLTSDERSRHLHVIGASGTGKSTLLYNLLRQDVENGQGFSLLDPHGDLIDRVLGWIPKERAGDVVLLDPADEEYVVGFNVLSGQSEWEKNMLASDLVSVFRRLSTAWGDQLNSVFQNAILAFLESSRGGTLHDVRRFLLEPAFRAEFLKTVHDPDVVYYWTKAFPALTGNKSVGPIVTRLDAFLSPKPIRYMVSQARNGIDFRDIMDSGKIFLARLSQGAIGRENSRLLGSLIVAKMQAEAMSRQRMAEGDRRFHWLYLDEFHEFLTPSLADCLTGARKYRLGLVLAHQEMRQVEREPDVASAVLNAYTRVVFRVNERDSRALEGGFSSFGALDIQSQPTGHAICRVERSDHDFNLAVDAPQYRETDASAANRKEAVEGSRRRYGTPRQEVEEALRRAADAPRQSTGGSARPPVSEPPPAEPSEKVTSNTSPRAAEPIPVPADLGKGGVQHKAIQNRVKDAAEKLGFRVSVEQDAAGLGQIDLVLVREGEAIACEVTVTGTIDYEVGNVSKCLRAGFTRVAVIGAAEEKLARLSAAVKNSLGAERAQSVGFFLPDAFIESLGLAPEAEPAAAPPVRTRGGRVVKRTVVTLSPAEAKAKEEQGIQLMAELMRRKRAR